MGFDFFPGLGFFFGNDLLLGEGLSIVLEMVEIEFVDGVFGCEIKQPGSIILKFLISFDGMKNKIFDLAILFLVVVVFGHVPDGARYLLIDFWLDFLNVLHEGVDPFDFTQGHHELVPLLQVGVDVVGQVRVPQQCFVHLYKTLVLVIAFFISSEFLTQFLVRVGIRIFQFFKPFFCLLYTQSFHSGN